jgi:hypothetical protein
VALLLGGVTLVVSLLPSDDRPERTKQLLGGFAVEDYNAVSAPASAGLTVDYEAPQVLDLGAVFDVTYGSAAGSADSNGQGQH